MSRRAPNCGEVVRIATIILALAALAACDADRSITGGRPGAPPLPPGQAPIIGAIEGSVDAATGQVTFEPLDPSVGRSVAPGISAAIYGTQNVNVRLYSTPIVVDSTSTTKTWSFRLGVRNYLSYPIGSDQGTMSPSDTMGIFVALISGPTVVTTSGSCSPCTIQLTNADGVASFTAPNQPYFYWHQVLAAKQPKAGADTTNTRRLWTFTSPRAVTSFRFVMIVSAAWPPPNQTSWSVFYNAATDSEPDLHAEPPWKQAGVAGGGTESWSGGLLTFNATGGNDIYMYRADSLAPAASAYIETSMKLNGTAQTLPENVIALQDGTHMAAVGVIKNEAGFVQFTSFFGFSFWQFITTKGATYKFPKGVSATSLHTYRLRKFGADSVTLEMDGTRVAGLAVSALPAASTSLPGTTFFGVASVSGTANTSWSYVTYGIGSSQP